MLAPPSDGLESLEEQGGAAGTLAALLGAIGVAATALRPAGKAQFADDYLDVVAEGSYVQAGARVQIIEIEGNRIVVKEV
jgi:membrane-bound serine protease (ClpP class)